MSKIIENINSTNQSSIKEDVKFKTKKPSMYRVLMLNVHKTGSGLCGVYSYEIAETKTLQAMKVAKESGHPLQCIFKKN